MNLYETPVSRVACAIIAVTLAAITIAVAVVIPAKVESGSHEPLTLKTTPPAGVINVFIPPAVTDDVTRVGSVNVVGVRGPTLSAVPCVRSHRKPNTESRGRPSAACSPAAT